MPHSRSLFPTLLLTGVAGWAATEPPSAATVFDAYIAQAARTIPEYRTDLQPGAASAELPGRMVARGPIVGEFSFRPKTYAELSRAERAEILRDPRFRAFLLALRSHADRSNTDAAPRAQAPMLPAQSARPALEQFEISAEEMLQSRPLFIVLASP